MNFYGLPEFIAYAILVGIAVSLIKQKTDERLKYWLVAWILILLHSAIYMLVEQRFPYDVVGRATLAIAGQAFILAAYHQKATPTNVPQILRQVGLSGVPNLIFAVGSVACVDLYPGDDFHGPFLLLIALGAVGACWLGATDKTTSRLGARVIVALALSAYGVQTLLLYTYGLMMASQWLMCWTYLAVAFFFVWQTPKLTMGVLFTALSFALWGIVFPVYSLLMIYAPDVLNHIESMVWNLPKFLAAASMILVLLEELVSRATYLATHDELTGLPNRRLYEDRFDRAVARAKRENSGFAVLVVDINRFKQINDTLGHQAGDQLLKAVSERFRDVLRTSDTLARTGGDEFSISLDGVTTKQSGDRISMAIRESLSPPIILAGQHHQVSASVGAAIYPEDGSTQTDLHAIADERMYVDKERSRIDSSRKGTVVSMSRISVGGPAA